MSPSGRIKLTKRYCCSTIKHHSSVNARPITLSVLLFIQALFGLRGLHSQLWLVTTNLLAAIVTACIVCQNFPVNTSLQCTAVMSCIYIARI